MRHLKSYRKLGKESAHRRAMLRNMATDFLEYGKIHTTVPRAKELRRVVEKIITSGKKKDLHSRRRVESYLFSHDVAGKVCNEIAERFSDTNGGYTRIVKHGPRFGDGANMCNLELVDYGKQEGKLKVQAKKEKESEEKAKKESEEAGMTPS